MFNIDLASKKGFRKMIVPCAFWSLKLFLMTTLMGNGACGKKGDPEELRRARDQKVLSRFVEIENTMREYAVAYGVRWNAVNEADVDVDYIGQINGLDELGICSRVSGGGPRTLFVKRGAGDTVMAHELGHCALDAPHYADKMDIMNPILSNSARSAMDKNLAVYLEKMFERLSGSK